MPPLFINFDAIERVSKHKVLGIILDEKLRYQHHIQYICKKVSKGISILHQLRNTVPEFVLKCLYNAHILPHILYCNALWGGTFSTHLQPLFILQKRAVRIISKSLYYDHTQPIFKRLKILKLYDQVKLEVATYMFKNRNSLDFQRRLHNYNTRQYDNLILPRHDLTQYERSISYAGPKLWNSLSNQLKTITTIKSFRRQYKKELLTMY